ncbi:coiled-coil domain-containing protein [Gracilibacillus sp. Marseille-QA3620]
MPKIHRIRIVGLRYDGMQKQYEDTTFDFHNEETSTNGLIAMMNGGGKGVFLQTIFQVLKPGTSWGKQNNRFYQQFFFNKKEQFAPYTFHVLIQWELDGSDKRHLVTGGMFSAEQRMSMNEEAQDADSMEREAKIVPNITFYAREFDRKEDVALEHIPLFENGEVADTEELKDYFKWNGFDVYKDVKKHYRILDTYGINRKDWDIMKEINRDEGGVGKFFEGAEDDHSLFQKRIIPTVSQVLNKSEHQKNDLIEIFKSQASIARDLPVLLKREQAHKEFLEDVIPFEEHIEAGVKQEEIVVESKKKGQALLGALEHLIKQDKEELTSLAKEMEKLTEELSLLRFEKDNLEYARAHEEAVTWEKKLAEEKEKLEQLQKLAVEKQAEKDEAAFSLLLKEWSEFENTIANLNQQMGSLERNSGLEQVNTRMEEIKHAVQSQWTEVSEKLKEENDRYHAFKLHLEKSIRSLTKDDKQKTIEITQIKTDIRTLTEELQRFEIKASDMVKAYGDRAAYDLDGLVGKLKNDQTRLADEMNDLKGKEKQSQQFQGELSNTVGTLTESLKHMKERLDEWKQAYEKQEKKETALIERMHAFLDDVSAPLSHAMLSKYGHALEDILQKNEEETEQIKKELWEVQTDQYLNDESFWIANQDVKQMKEWIDEKTGIDVFYGSQYVQSLDDEAKRQHLKSYPLLPFGLVVSQIQWEKINHHLLQGKIFRSPVPIFLREEMKDGGTDSFVIIDGEERDLLMDRQSFAKWKTSMAKQIEEKKEAIQEFAKTEQAIRRLTKDIDRMTDADLCTDLLRQMEKQEALIDSAQRELTHTVKTLEKERELQTGLQEQMNQKQRRIDETEKDLAEVTAFVEEKHQSEDNKTVLAEKEKRRDKLTTEQQELGKLLDDYTVRLAQWNHTHLEWKMAMEQDLKEIGAFVEDAVFPTLEKTEPSEEAPSLPSHLLDAMIGHVTELKQLQRSKEEQSQELTLLKAKKEAEQAQAVKLEKKLTKQDENWREKPKPEEPLSILEGLFQSAQKEAREADKEERKQEKEVTVAETTLKHALDQRKKAEKKLSKHEKEPETWEGQDLDVKELEIKDRTKIAKDRLKKAEKGQKETDARITGYEGDQLTLSVILKDEAAPFANEDLETIKNQGKSCILSWCDEHQGMQEEKQVKHAKLEQALRKLKLAIEEKDWEIRFKNEVLTSLDHMDTRHYAHMLTIIQNMKRFSRSGLEQLDLDKERAEKARDVWTNRASMKVMSMTDAIRSMLAKMKIKNERGTFPLVQLKEDILPRRVEDIEPLLKQYFVTAIDKISAQFDSIDENNKQLDQEIKQLIGDEQILFVALRNRYPELLVYNMRTDNAFMYGKPQKEHYSTWRTINQGSRTKSDGSGGQKLSARMVMMMMLLSVKTEADNSWVPLVCDNPFGQAASAHVLDPIFAVAEKLKFQLIIVTPPELVKTEISQRFDAYYKLDFIRSKGKEIVTDTVVPAYRIYQGEAVQ